MANPHVFVERAADDHITIFNFTHFHSSGPECVRQLDAAAGYYNQLLASNLPFYVRLSFELVIHNPNRGYDHSWGNQLPYIPINDHHAQRHPWPELVSILQGQFMLKIDHMENLPSGCHVVGVVHLRLTFVTGNSITRAIARTLRGGVFVEINQVLKNKRCLVNIRNLKGFDCFRNCITCHMKKWHKKEKGCKRFRAEEWRHYVKGEIPWVQRKKLPDDYRPEPIDLPGVDFSSLPRDAPMPLTLIDKFEEDNNRRFNVFVYGWVKKRHGGVETEGLSFLRTPKYDVAPENEIKLLLWQGHYIYIANYNKLASRRSMGVRLNNSHMHCHCLRCDSVFNTADDMRKHMLRIHTWRDKAICGKWRLPDLNKDGTEPKKCFTAHGHRFFHPCVVYSDFEEFWEKTPDGYEGKASAHMEVVGCNAKVASVAGVVADRGYKAPERLRAFMSRESNCMVAYFQHLFAVAYDYSEARANPKPLEKTPEVRRRHAQARKCYLCTKDFDSDNKAVMDHDHWTGAYRGAACDKCNKMAQNPRDVRVFFHNFSHYDCHALLRFITLLRRKELDGEPNNITARQLVEGRSLPADVVGMDIDDLDAGGEGEEADLGAGDLSLGFRFRV